MKKLLLSLSIGLCPLLSMASEGATTESSGSWTTFIWIAAILFFVTGIVLGCKKVIVIYNDYLDIVISGLIFIFPIIMGLIIDPGDTELSIFFAIVESGLLAFMLYRTFRFNVNPIAALYALVIKIVFSLIAVCCIPSLWSGSQKEVNTYQDIKDRAFLLAILAAFVALVYKMIKEQQWMDSTSFVDLRIEKDKTGRDEEVIRLKAKKYHTFVIAFCVGFAVLLSGWCTYNIISNAESTEMTNTQQESVVVVEGTEDELE